MRVDDLSLRERDRERLASAGFSLSPRATPASAEAFLAELTPQRFALLAGILLTSAGARGLSRFGVLRFLYRHRHLRYGGLDAPLFPSAVGMDLFATYLTLSLPQMAARASAGLAPVESLEMASGFNALIEALELARNLRPDSGDTLDLEVISPARELAAVLRMVVAENHFVSCRVHAPKEQAALPAAAMTLRLSARDMAATYAAEGANAIVFLGRMMWALSRVEVECRRRGRLQVDWWRILGRARAQFQGG
ncbi:MAG: hypothetical protein HYV63_13950 [Candidatus Schekmanbacteria bacterium]|nr:hypothetical protein [Candidatus Schekmanbacteria bacterium]